MPAYSLRFQETGNTFRWSSTTRRAGRLDAIYSRDSHSCRSMTTARPPRPTVLCANLQKYVLLYVFSILCTYCIIFLVCSGVCLQGLPRRPERLPGVWPIEKYGLNQSCILLLRAMSYIMNSSSVYEYRSSYQSSPGALMYVRRTTSVVPTRVCFGDFWCNVLSLLLITTM